MTEAGPELNAEVAEKVMGWVRHDVSYTIWDMRPDLAGDDKWSGCLHTGFSLPKFSEDITAAWEVVEKMRLSLWRTSDGRWFVWQDREGFDPGGFEEYWFDLRVEDEQDNEGVIADTAPLAICLAALKAHG